MTRNGTPSPAEEIDRALKYNPVFNRRNERVRGLWERNGNFYAQVKVRGWTGQVPLHVTTVVDAVAARQVLKTKIKSGDFLTPVERAEKEKKEQADGESQGAKTHVLKEAVEKYKVERDTLGKKDPDTCKRENSSLKKWVGWKPELVVAAENFDAKFLKNFALWCKRQAKKKQKKIEGRSIDIAVTALANLLRWCVVEKWLTEFPPAWHWDAMAVEPDECPLLTDAQVDQLCSTALSLSDMGFLKRGEKTNPDLQKYTEELTAARQNFSDYLRLLALTGAREQETIRQQWLNVRWNQRKFHFAGGRAGGAKKGGGSRRAGRPRDVDFHDKLEAHLKEMYERRNPQSDWMFPNKDGSNHIKSFRKQLLRVRKACKIPDLGFHFFRHYFISWCVMRGVDVKTIARWVNHLDEGMLILQKYGHLAPGHGQEAAKKLSGAWH